MKAIDLAKKLYPKISKTEFIYCHCPYNYLICENNNCDEVKADIKDCIKCWKQDINQARVDWLLESKKMCDFICNY